MSQLFSPITLRSVTARNRVWVSPMCQYSAVDGVPNDWHLVHLGSFARGGAGLVFTEATAVSPEGRISPADAGLWNDEQQQEWARIVAFVHDQGASAGIQLAHAGRKASSKAPWDGRGFVADEDGGWEPVGPSAIAFPALREPRELTTEEIAGVVSDFGATATRAIAAGFDVLEVHAAHGYLLHEFLSPLSNQRIDEYGGSFDNRVRLLLDVVAEVRDRVSAEVPVVVRISATDWVEGGWTAEDSVRLAALLREAGVDLVDVSTGGNALADIPVEPGYQVRFARQVRAEASIPTGAVGLITEPKQAEEIVADGSADVVLLARALLRDPHWALRAAHELGVEVGEGIDWPKQYQRAAL
ncbi:NADH:flavin oxidoreductase/NADH oxidase [Nocardioides panaciterrulae]|uniref:2,4-dienoyl-CoA reductase-like NADH-dependent reductase (Old Yellow Enzyme family) n=1 Tax=Nocardioides panaciterrulae TaxID=661492 RepID=A0A7Y9E8W6_9ACTN|nr:2,4-dienoyl-CoA reductase-like NADH-dependent reductase (Old Yellow Enzyme family) [Nocardioides panaciterrulae]